MRQYYLLNIDKKTTTLINEWLHDNYNSFLLSVNQQNNLMFNGIQKRIQNFLSSLNKQFSLNILSLSNCQILLKQLMKLVYKDINVKLEFIGIDIDNFNNDYLCIDCFAYSRGYILDSLFEQYKTKSLDVIVNENRELLMDKINNSTLIKEINCPINEIITEEKTTDDITELSDLSDDDSFGLVLNKNINIDNLKSTYKVFIKNHIKDDVINVEFHLKAHWDKFYNSLESFLKGILNGAQLNLSEIVHRLNELLNENIVQNIDFVNDFIVSFQKYFFNLKLPILTFELFDISKTNELPNGYITDVFFYELDSIREIIKTIPNRFYTSLEMKDIYNRNKIELNHFYYFIDDKLFSIGPNKRWEKKDDQNNQKEVYDNNKNILINTKKNTTNNSKTKVANDVQNSKETKKIWEQLARAINYYKVQYIDTTKSKGLLSEVNDIEKMTNFVFDKISKNKSFDFVSKKMIKEYFETGHDYAILDEKWISNLEKLNNNEPLKTKRLTYTQVLSRRKRFKSYNPNSII